MLGLFLLAFRRSGSILVSAPPLSTLKYLIRYWKLCEFCAGIHGPQMMNP